MNSREQYNIWLSSPALTADEKAELIAIQDDADEIALRFSAPLSFGTAGLRGTMGMGIHNMNRFTVAQATAGLASYILKMGMADKGVAIAHDCRRNGRLFAEVSASVLVGAGIRVYMFESLRPTPELSFALRHYGCVAGINVTASHNPKAYNGYKAYWEDGAQLSPEQADAVSEVIASSDVLSVCVPSFDETKNSPLFRFIGEETDEVYLQKVLNEATNLPLDAKVGKNLKIVYTPLHGTGYKLVPEVLRRAGFENIVTVDSQMTPDGDFPTVKKPNPEYPEAFADGIVLADKFGSDLIIATDPDADRVGVMARAKDGSFKTVTGNQMGALLCDYLIQNEKKQGHPLDGVYVVKSIVSTDLVTDICAREGVTLFNVLTGFKFIGEVIKKHDDVGVGRFLLGFEESYGYLKGTYARDKDAVVASLLIAEMTACYADRGMTLIDALDDLFLRYGYRMERNAETYYEGVNGQAEMDGLMASLREQPLTEIAGVPVTSTADYKTGVITEHGKTTPTGLPSANVLLYRLSNGDTVVVRPSGTEPKVKFYFMLKGENESECLAKLERYKKAMA